MSFLNSAGLFNAIPDSGVARWTFDDADTSGSTATDVWNDNDGTINGATTGVSGANQTYDTAEAYSFDGTDDDVTIGDISSQYGADSPWTVASWAKADSTGGEQNVYSIESSGTFDFILGLEGGNWILKTFSESDSSKPVVTGPSASTGNWRFLVGVVKSNDDIEFYFDGSSEGTNSNHSGDWNDQDEHFIGNGDAGSERFDGDIDDVRFYNKALTSTEVSNLYNTGSI